MRLKPSDTEIRDCVPHLRPFRLTLYLSNAMHSLSIFITQTLMADYTGNPNLEATTAALIWIRTTRDSFRRFYQFSNSTQSPSTTSRSEPWILLVDNARHAGFEGKQLGTVPHKIAHPVPIDITTVSHVYQCTLLKYNNLIRHHFWV